MTIRKTAYVQGTAASPYKLPAEDHRLTRSGLWLPSSVGGLRVRSGVVWGPGNPGAVTVTTGGVNIAPFVGVIQGTRTATQGQYEIVSDATEFRGVTAPNSTEFRRGYVIARQYDRLHQDSSDDTTIEVIYGPNAATAAAATLPALPANSFILREFAVSNTGTITLVGITDRTGPRGGILPMETADASLPAYDGQYRDHPTRGLERGFGGAWGVPSPLPYCQAVATAGQAFANNTWSVVTLHGETHDSDNMHAANGTRITAPVKGIYRASGSVAYGVPGAVTRIGARITYNNTIVPQGIAMEYAHPGAEYTVGAPPQLITCGPGDYLELQTIQQSGGNLSTIVNADSRSYLTVECVRQLA